MVSLPSGPLHHRPLPTTWLLVGGGRQASSNCAQPPEHSDRLAASLVILTGVATYGERREAQGREKGWLCDLGNPSLGPWFSCQ